MRAYVLLLVAACSEPALPAVVVTPPPVEVAVELEAQVPESANGSSSAPIGDHPTSGLVLDQPAHIKLRLGHYRDRERGIGLVIDRTDPERGLDSALAKVRFDHEKEIWLAQPQPGPYGRIDYFRDGTHVLLHVWETGRIVLYLPDPGSGRGLAALELARDGDAYPLPNPASAR